MNKYNPASKAKGLVEEFGTKAYRVVEEIIKAIPDDDISYVFWQDVLERVKTYS